MKFKETLMNMTGHNVNNFTLPKLVPKCDTLGSRLGFEVAQDFT